MATIKIIVDSRRHSEDEECPLKLRVTQGRKSSYISLGFSVLPSNYDADKMKVTGRNAKPLNTLIYTRYVSAQQVLLDLARDGEIESKTCDQLKTLIERAWQGAGGLIDEEETGVPSFTDFFKAQAEGKTAKRTRELYLRTLKTIVAFSNGSQPTFEDITHDWLGRYDAFLSLTAPSANARAIDLRNIRSVMNAAIDEGYTQNYPFRKFKIKNTPTRKRSLSAAKLREIATMEIRDEYTAYFRDMFILSFLLIGMNTIDMYNLESVDSEGRVSYIRAKTGRDYDIKVEPEAWDIINRHRGKKRLLDIADRYAADYTNFTEKSSLHLKKLFPDLSMYWARHTWATIASELDVPLETISAALGHSLGSRVTAVYINFNRKKIDEANRKVIDYIYNR